MGRVRRMRGFSLVEMLLVVTCMGIIVLAVAPRIASGVAYYRVERTASQLAGALRFAQSQAMRTSRATGVEVVARRTAEAKYGFDDGNWFRVYDDADSTDATCRHPVTHRPFLVDLDTAEGVSPVLVERTDVGGNQPLVFSPDGEPSSAAAAYRVKIGDEARLVWVQAVTGRVEMK